MLDAGKKQSALKVSMYVMMCFLVMSLAVGLSVNGIHADSLSAMGQRISQSNSTETRSSSTLSNSTKTQYNATAGYVSPVAEFPSNVNVFLVSVVGLTCVLVMIAVKRRERI